jgi:uncharacterized protein YwqG
MSETPITKIQVEDGLFVSKAFAKYWLEIKKTEQEYISIIATLSKDVSKTQNFFGSYPFLPKGIEYPIDHNGELMFPLAQLNFSEIPTLKGYPERGILQFFVSMSDDVYGMDFDEQDNQEGFCVRYYEDISKLEFIDDMSFIDSVFDYHTGPCPLYDSHKLSFNVKKEYIGLEDICYTRTGKLNINNWIKENPDFEDELFDESWRLFSSNEHKIGGYAYFTQTDPREYLKKFRDYVLLFQMSGDEEIMWGDGGVGNFFIHPQDLARKDFSKVMYNWDCG